MTSKKSIDYNSFINCDKNNCLNDLNNFPIFLIIIEKKKKIN